MACRSQSKEEKLAHHHLRQRSPNGEDSGRAKEDHAGSMGIHIRERGGGRMRRLARGRVLAALGLLIAVTLVFVARWLNANKIGGQGPAEPFRIAGNFYYVGATDVSAFLITGPEGHIVLDAGYPPTAKMIIGSIAKLGFDIKDVKVLVNSEPHPDHAGGLAVLQQASGAEVWASDWSADSLASGG